MEEGLAVNDDGSGFRLDGAAYGPGDTVFLLPDTFDQCVAAVEDTRNAVPDFAAKSRHVKVCSVPVLLQPPGRSGHAPCSHLVLRADKWLFGNMQQGGANARLRAYGIGEIVALGAAKKGKSKKGAAAADQVTVRRFYRPEDISRDAAYTAAFTDVYESGEQLAVPLDSVVAKCRVLPPGEALTGAPHLQRQ